MKGRANVYTAAELAWIETRKSWPRRELHAAFLAAFSRDDVTLGAFKNLCKRKGWMTGRSGCFVKGQASWNKGKPMPSHPNSRKTQFRKGHRGGRAEALYKPIGTERLCKDGYLERKIHDGLPLQSRWRAVHLIRWEEINGPVPEGHCLKSLDGDKTNTDPSNWIAIPRAMLPRLAGGNRYRQLLAFDDAPDDLKPTVLATAKLEHAAREARKGEADG